MNKSGRYFLILLMVVAWTVFTYFVWWKEFMHPDHIIRGDASVALLELLSPLILAVVMFLLYQMFSELLKD